MEITWLEDFLALVEAGSFNRAGERRNITSPAFGRRIRALETWVGASLFHRGPTVTLTAAGETFRPIAEELLRRLYSGRENAQEAARVNAETLRFASTHVLSLTFFPMWLRELESRDPMNASMRLMVDNMMGCERIMMLGHAQFLLCHHHPAAATALEPDQFDSVHVGDDVLLPVSAPDAQGRPRYELPGTPEAPLPHLAYGPESGMGRIFAAVRAIDGLPPVCFQEPFTSHVAAVLALMARGGRGVAWSPQSFVASDLAAGSLVRAGTPQWEIPLQIRLFRPRVQLSDQAERFWNLAASAEFTVPENSVH